MNEVMHTNTASLNQHLSDYLSRVILHQDVVSIDTQDGNALLLSEERYRQLESASQELVFLSKYDEGIAQIHAGNGIMKTMEELKALE